MANAAANPQALVQEIVKKTSTIATLPEVTARIISTVEDPKSTASKLHQIISHDPALVTRILKVVNSAFYGLPGQIGSVERAIVLLGLNAIKNIAVAASIGQLFRMTKICKDFTAKDLWTHCIAVGVCARDLAKQMKLPIADEAFLAGMIHDVGILLQLQTSPEQLRQVCEAAQGDGNFCEMERKIIGIDHQMLGAALCEQWKFPHSCQLVAGNHHTPTKLTDQNRGLVNLVWVADTICCQSKHGFNLTARSQKFTPGDLAEMKVDPTAVERTTGRIDELMSVASVVLG